MALPFVACRRLCPLLPPLVRWCWCWCWCAHAARRGWALSRQLRVESAPSCAHVNTVTPTQALVAVHGTLCPVSACQSLLLGVRAIDCGRWLGGKRCQSRTLNFLTDPCRMCFLLLQHTAANQKNGVCCKSCAVPWDATRLGQPSPAMTGNGAINTNFQFARSTYNLEFHRFDVSDLRWQQDGLKSN